jgi:ArsR family metal-binding transcriptional regulator
MLLKNIEPKVARPECDYKSEFVRINGKCMQDISPVMPLLNATQPDALYQKDAKILRFRFKGYPVTLRSHEIAIAGMADSDEAIGFLTQLQKLVNDTWDSRNEITPSTLERKRLHPMAVYKRLPGTNCRECGQQTCFIFANKMVAGEVNFDQCVPLCSDDAYADKKSQMIELIESAI